MRKFLLVALTVASLLMPAVASASHIVGLSVAGYSQSQTQGTAAGQAQGHFGNGIQAQNQHGGDSQFQASGNQSSTVLTNAESRGANVQVQGYSQTNAQASFGSGPSFQVQSSGQEQYQTQSSRGLAVSHVHISW